MILYKCSNCGLLISDVFKKCPECNSEDNKILFNTEEGIFYSLCEDDIESVINNEYFFTIAERDKLLSDNTIEEIADNVGDKIEIPWVDYIEAFIRCRYLD